MPGISRDPTVLQIQRSSASIAGPSEPSLLLLRRQAQSIQRAGDAAGSAATPWTFCFESTDKGHQVKLSQSCNGITNLSVSLFGLRCEMTHSDIPSSGVQVPIKDFLPNAMAPSKKRPAAQSSGLRKKPAAKHVDTDEEEEEEEEGEEEEDDEDEEAEEEEDEEDDAIAARKKPASKDEKPKSRSMKVRLN